MDIVEKLSEYENHCIRYEEMQAAELAYNAAKEITTLRQQLAEQTSSVTVYQVKCGELHWLDVVKEAYDMSEPHLRRVLYLQDAEQTSFEPLIFIPESSLKWAQSGKANGIGQFSYVQRDDHYTVPLFTTPPSVEVLVKALRKAVEHAEYMAKGADSLLSHLNDISDIEEGTINPDERFGDYTGSLRNYVYEFRKRAERATYSKPITAEEIIHAPPK